MQSNDKEKEIYFIVFTPNEEKLNFNDLKFLYEISPTKIFDKNVEKVKGSFLEENVFKIIIKKEEEIGKTKKKKTSTKYD